MLEAISLKLDKGLLKDIDANLKKHRYSTRTEFIRDAIRHELTDLEKQELLRTVDQVWGASKHKTSDEALHAVREQLTEKNMKEGKEKFRQMVKELGGKILRPPRAYNVK